MFTGAVQSCRRVLPHAFTILPALACFLLPNARQPAARHSPAPPARQNRGRAHVIAAHSCFQVRGGAFQGCHHDIQQTHRLNKTTLSREPLPPEPQIMHPCRFGPARLCQSAVLGVFMSRGKANNPSISITPHLFSVKPGVGYYAPARTPPERFQHLAINGCRRLTESV